MAKLALEGITKVYADDQAAVDAIDLAVNDGELVVLVGPSGCGKSTTLRLIAGLETPTAGRVLLDKTDITALPPQDRDLAMVFQSYALYPHKTVRDNLAFGLRMRRTPRPEIDERIARAARALGIETLLQRKPAQLSGGQRQRVALGRAIVREPRAFLFDEPLSNLDPRLRVQARTELTLLHRRLGATIVYVTHDQEEAMTLGDRIAVMRAGRIQQLGAPREVYEKPANVFVAEFIGSPAMNLFRCRTASEDTSIRIACPAFSLLVDRMAIIREGTPADLAEGGVATDIDAGRDVVAGIRPHDVSIVPLEDADTRGAVQLVEMLGSTLLAHVQLESEDSIVRVTASADTAMRADDVVGLRILRERLHLFRASDGERIAR